jgi:tryptophan synthase beta chain
MSPVGSHKPNTAVPQAFYNKEEGIKAMTTETGAGQWGSALSMACNFFDMDLEVYMVRVSYDHKPYRRIMMQMYGADLYPSPSDRTEFGRAVLADDPNSPGSLGIAISEAVEVAAMSGGQKKYGLGSVLNHVLLHQTVIGQETLAQLEMAGEYPDMIIACTGGGSNFGGFAFPFLHENFTNGKQTKVIAVEPSASPTLTKGEYTFDYGDSAKMAPVVKMHTLGHTFMPPAIHAGGLRYHGMSPQVSALVNNGDVEARSVNQLDTFRAGMIFTQSEGIIPAPESTHAIAVAVEEALKCKESGEKKVIVFNLSGHGHFDMASYDAYLKGELSDYAYPEEEIAAAMAFVPQVS